MTKYVVVLKELMIIGREGAALLVAFERMCAAMADSHKLLKYFGLEGEE